MKSLEFDICGKKIVYEEQDYVSAVFFKILYQKTETELQQYENYLERVNSINLGQVKRCLTKVKAKEEIDDSAKSIIPKIDEFLYGEELEKICEELIESYNVHYLIRELKKCNEHFDSFDFEEKVKYGIDKIKRKLYEKRVENDEKIVKGKSYEEYQKLWTGEVADDVLEAERIGQIKDLSYIGTFFEKYVTLLPIDDSQIIGLSYSEIYKMCEKVLELSNSVNRKKFIGKFRYECLKNICLMLVDLKEKFEIPIRTNYFTERNYNDFVRIYKFQYEKNEKYMDKISIVENLMRFPFAIDQYTLVIKYCGDCDKQLEQYAKGFFIDIIPIKIKQLEQFISENVQIKMDEENQVKDAYEKINRYKDFIGLDYKTPIEKELQDKIEEFDILYRTENGKTYKTRDEA